MALRKFDQTVEKYWESKEVSDQEAKMLNELTEAHNFDQASDKMLID